MNAGTTDNSDLAQAHPDRARSTRPVRLVIELFDNWSDSTAAARSAGHGTSRPRLCGGYCSIDQLDLLEAAA